MMGSGIPLPPLRNRCCTQAVALALPPGRPSWCRGRHNGTDCGGSGRDLADRPPLILLALLRPELMGELKACGGDGSGDGIGRTVNETSNESLYYCRDIISLCSSDRHACYKRET